MATQPMKIVEQTGTTIIFEEFNRFGEINGEPIPDLVTLLTKDFDKVSREKFVDTLNKKLSVRSFEEFIKKFSPTIYETIQVDENQNPCFSYSLEKPQDGRSSSPIQFTEHAYYKMIMGILNQKETSGKSNIEFPYDELKKALSPESQLREAKKIRKNLQTNTIEYLKLLDSGKPSPDKEKYEKNIVECRKQIISKYQNKSPMDLFPLIIADAQAKLDAFNDVPQLSDDQNSTLQLSYIPSFDNQGRLTFTEAPQEVTDNGESKLLLSDQANQKLLTVLGNDFDQKAPAIMRESTFVKNVILHSFVSGGSMAITKVNKNELMEMKKMYQDIYNYSLESFTKAITSLAEKFAGVKTFFDHATSEGELAPNVKVIITNCFVDDIINDAVALDRFKDYFINQKNETTERIWFGVIPAVKFESDDDVSTQNQDCRAFGDIIDESNQKPRRKKDKTLYNTLGGVKSILPILKDAGILTFFNEKASEENGFMNITADKVRKYRKDISIDDNEYAAFAYPNFTILPKDATAVETGSSIKFDYDTEESASYISVPGVYLDASYVAAGISVGTQNHKLLKKLGFTKINDNYPCVRFDLEAGDNFKIVKTKLNRELSTQMDQNLVDEITSDEFGFVFADNKKQFNGKILQNSYVLNARTMKQNEKGRYQNVYKTLVKNLVKQILWSNKDKITKKTFEDFIKEYVTVWKDDSQLEKTQYDNRILFEGEDITIGENNNPKVTFNKNPEIWNDVNIDDDENENETN